MRVVVLFVAAAVLVLGLAPAKAQDAPFCTVDSTGWRDCNYFDVRSCREIARAMGGFCAARGPEPIVVPGPPAGAQPPGSAWCSRRKPDGTVCSGWSTNGCLTIEGCW
jgi:hypothetical protein